MMNDPEPLAPRRMPAEPTTRASPMRALAADDLGEGSATVDDISAADAEFVPFTPFGRGDERALTPAMGDERLIGGDPEPLCAFVPVTIDPESATFRCESDGP